TTAITLRRFGQRPPSQPAPPLVPDHLPAPGETDRLRGLRAGRSGPAPQLGGAFRAKPARDDGLAALLALEPLDALGQDQPALSQVLLDPLHRNPRSLAHFDDVCARVFPQVVSDRVELLLVQLGAVLAQAPSDGWTKDLSATGAVRDLHWPRPPRVIPSAVRRRLVSFFAADAARAFGN